MIPPACGNLAWYASNAVTASRYSWHYFPLVAERKKASIITISTLNDCSTLMPLPSSVLLEVEELLPVSLVYIVKVVIVWGAKFQPVFWHCGRVEDEREMEESHKTFDFVRTS
jgi:hypothetical protein